MMFVVQFKSHQCCVGPAATVGEGKCQQVWTFVIYLRRDGQNAHRHDRRN